MVQIKTSQENLPSEIPLEKKLYQKRWFQVILGVVFLSAFAVLIIVSQLGNTTINNTDVVAEKEKSSIQELNGWKYYDSEEYGIKINFPEKDTEVDFIKPGASQRQIAILNARDGKGTSVRIEIFPRYSKEILPLKYSKDWSLSEYHQKQNDHAMELYEKDLQTYGPCQGRDDSPPLEAVWLEHDPKTLRVGGSMQTCAYLKTVTGYLVVLSADTKSFDFLNSVAFATANNFLSTNQPTLEYSEDGDVQPLPAPYSVSIIYPAGGEVLKKGGVYEIKWRTSDFTPSDFVSLALVNETDGPVTWEGGGEFFIISTTNSGSYKWMVPTDWFDPVFGLDMSKFKIAITVSEPVSAGPESTIRKQAESGRFKIID